MRFLAFLIAIFVAASAEAAALTMGIYSVIVRVNTGIGHTADDQYVHNAIPASTTVDVFDENTYSKTTINFSVNGGQTILSFDMDHKKTGIYSSVAGSLNILNFTANSDEPYELSGYYNVTDVGASGRVHQRGELNDTTSNANQFYGEQLSDNTANEQFVLGGTSGDTTNNLIGSLTGTLIAGHKYNVLFDCRIEANPDADSGATALGNFTLKIGTVPEPSTLILLGIGAISLLGYRKAKSVGR